MTAAQLQLNELLDKLVRGTMTEEEREQLMTRLSEIKHDGARAPGERMAAIVLQATLEAQHYATD